MRTAAGRRTRIPGSAWHAGACGGVGVTGGAGGGTTKGGVPARRVARRSRRRGGQGRWRRVRRRRRGRPLVATSTHRHHSRRTCVHFRAVEGRAVRPPDDALCGVRGFVTPGVERPRSVCVSRDAYPKRKAQIRGVGAAHCARGRGVLAAGVVRTGGGARDDGVRGWWRRRGHGRRQAGRRASVGPRRERADVP